MRDHSQESSCHFVVICVFASKPGSPTDRGPGPYFFAAGETRKSSDHDFIPSHPLCFCVFAYIGTLSHLPHVPVFCVFIKNKIQTLGTPVGR
jgi:hypothetical protein